MSIRWDIRARGYLLSTGTVTRSLTVEADSGSVTPSGTYAAYDLDGTVVVASAAITGTSGKASIDVTLSGATVQAVREVWTLTLGGDTVVITTMAWVLPSTVACPLTAGALVERMPQLSGAWPSSQSDWGPQITAAWEEMQGWRAGVADVANVDALAQPLYWLALSYVYGTLATWPDSEYEARAAGYRRMAEDAYDRVRLDLSTDSDVAVEVHSDAIERAPAFPGPGPAAARR